jgi:hypothetical protein
MLASLRALCDGTSDDEEKRKASTGGRYLSFI